MIFFVVFLPLIGFLFCAFFGKKFNDIYSQVITTLLLFISSIFSWIIFFKYLKKIETEEIYLLNSCSKKSSSRICSKEGSELMKSVTLLFRPSALIILPFLVVINILSAFCKILTFCLVMSPIILMASPGPGNG